MIEGLGKFNKTMIASQGADSQTKSVSKRIRTMLKHRPPRAFHNRLRISEMGDPCIRKLVLHYLNPEVKDPAAPAATQLLFDQGALTHEWWQDQYYGRLGMLRGTWRCSVCQREVSGFRPKLPCATTIYIQDLDTKSTTCKELRMQWKYKETWVEFDAYGLKLVGKCDGILYLGQAEPETVLEIKTEDSDRWKLRDRPEPKDVQQASAYAFRLGLTKILLSYIEKSKWNTKDYFMDADPRAQDWVESQMKIVSELVKEGKPERAPLKCSSKSASRARRCGFRSFCF